MGKSTASSIIESSVNVGDIERGISTTSSPGLLNVDDEVLASFGYKQQLNRNYDSKWKIFGISFSIMGLVPSIASTISIGLMGGSVSFVWGWFITGFFLVAIGIGMSELASSIPTSGGLYFWSYRYAPEKYKVIISFFIGITNSLALSGALCSITYGLAEQVLACAQLMNSGFEVTPANTYGVYAGCIVLETIVTCLSSNFVAKLQSLSIYVNVFLVILIIIALPIGTKVNRGYFNDASFIFGSFENFSDWPDAWTFFQFGFMPAVWTIGAFDSCVHMSEEARDPSKVVPFGIIGSISVCWILGFFVNIVIAACMSTDYEYLMDSPTGQPLAQIISDSLGRRWAVAVVALITVGQFLMGSSVLIAISRQVFAFARDDGLPFSSYIKVVNEKLKTPLRSIVFCSIVSMLIGLLSIIGDTASNALFSLSVLGNYISWVTPQILRFCNPSANFEPGKFYLGSVWSPIINWISIVFQLFIIIMSCFPDYKEVTKDTMNYTIVLNGGTWIISLIYYFSYKRGRYIGPKPDLDDITDETIEVFDGLEAIRSGHSPDTSNNTKSADRL